MASPEPVLDEPLNLAARLPEEGELGRDELFDIFLSWTIDIGIALYEAQEEAILEIFDDKQVILNTPTGSGKSLVALAMHFFSFATGRQSVYTSPIKALVSEKFFDLCKQFGAENVGMMTGDASINRDAPILCCTQEILAQIALSESDKAEIDHAIIDEFHFYGDRERGMAWQLPLLLMPQTCYLLMSATLGDTKRLSDQLEERSGRPVALVKSSERPVPLSFEYSWDVLVHKIEELVEQNFAPVYVVNFTQRDCAELAQSLMSINFCTDEEKDALKAEMKGAKFDTPYGSTVRRYLRHGIAVHHGGLIPKYRFLTEQLAQKGLLKVIVGTDTLGVGINLPLRTVLFTKLCKFDGQKVRLLKVREFQQIAGRAGRKGYDDKGLVVAQAPEHEIENEKMKAKAEGNPKKMKKLRLNSPPERGYVHWDEDIFRQMATGEPEELTSRFTVDHAMLLNLLQRDDKTGYRALIELIALSHESDGKKSYLRQKARELFQSLRQAEIIDVVPRDEGVGQRVVLSSDLQSDFSIHHALSLFLVDVMARLEPEHPDYHLSALSFVEAILEDPRAVLYRQQDKIRTQEYQRMKAEGVDYHERQEKLDKVTYPKPDEEVILEAFRGFAQLYPWVQGFEPSPKSVARDMFESYSTFNEYINKYNMERYEGVLLRHLNQVYKTLRQNVPEQYKTRELHDVIAYLREVLARADSSLLQEWEALRDGREIDPDMLDEEPEPLDANMKAFRARVRAELMQIVGALAEDDLEEAAGLVRQAGRVWTPSRLEAALEPFFEDHDRIVFNHAARATHLHQLKRVAFGEYEVTQVLMDPDDENMWYLKGRVDLNAITDREGRLFALETIGY